jgi:hypothetical protein
MPDVRCWLAPNAPCANYHVCLYFTCQLEGCMHAPFVDQPRKISAAELGRTGGGGGAGSLRSHFGDFIKHTAVTTRQPDVSLTLA